MGTDGSVDIEEVHVGYIDIFTTDPKAFCLRVKAQAWSREYIVANLF